MDVFLMIRRLKTTIFIDAKETTTVLEVKRMVEGILKKKVEDQRLFSKDNQIMDDAKQLSEYGYTHTTARAQLPETIGLAYRLSQGPPTDKDEYEPFEVTPLSQPPDLPDVMKNDSSASGGMQQGMDLSDK